MSLDAKKLALNLNPQLMPHSYLVSPLPIFEIVDNLKVIKFYLIKNIGVVMKLQSRLG